MKNLRWIMALGILAVCSALSLAQSVPPPDGAIGTKGGGKSTPITSLSTPFSFSSCSGATGDVAFDCALFGGSVQEVFAGINETGQAWNTLSIGLSGLNPADGTVGCDGGAIFKASNCPITIPLSGSVVVTFLQAGGTGIGCYNPNLSLTDPTNVACFANSAANGFYDSQHPGANLPYWNPPQTGGCSPPSFFPPGAVCGSDEFVIGVGVNDLPFTSLPVGGLLIANSPEPQTILLVGGAMLSMLMLGLKKAKLV